MAPQAILDTVIQHTQRGIGTAQQLIHHYTGYQASNGLILAIVTCLALVPIYKGYRRRNITARVKHVASRKRLVKERNLAKYDTDRPPVSHHEEILSLTATELVKAIREKRYSAEDVMRVYVWAAVKSERKLNCLTECRFDEAIAEARRADAQLASGKSLGPLHGLPFSVKDSLDLEGCDSTLGVAKRCFKPAAKDFELGKMLVHAGAIPFCKTNVPQTLLSFECDNPIWGRTDNPHDHTRAPGGSSGGEGALIADRGSPVGIGTDIGGSVRIPAAFCGIYGIKPTMARFSRIGAVSSVPGQAGIPGVIGPLGQSVEDLAMVLRAWLQEDMWKTDLVAPMPFSEDDYQGKDKLTIAYYDDDGFLTPCPSYKRAVAQAVAALKAKGHTVVPWTPPDVPGMMNLYYSLLSVDGAETISRELEGEVVSEAVKTILAFIKLPAPVRKLARFVVTNVLGWKRTSQVVSALKPRSVSEYWQLLYKRDQYRRSFLAAMNEKQIDAIIAPGHTILAVPHGTSKDLTPACCYTMLYNLMDLPTGTVPVTRATDADMKGLQEMKAHAREKLQKDVIRACEGGTGLPVGVQVAAGPYREELCLRVMGEIASSVKYS